MKNVLLCGVIFVLQCCTIYFNNPKNYVNYATQSINIGKGDYNINEDILMKDEIKKDKKGIYNKFEEGNSKYGVKLISKILACVEQII